MNFRLFIIVAVLVTLPISGFAAAIKVAIPLGDVIDASNGISWRDAAGHKGKSNSVALAGKTFPLRLRGKGTAVSAGRKFPLPIEIKKVSGKPYALLVLPFKDYLAGVIPHEMHPDWPTEALKAQAVLARTFALRKQQERLNQGTGYDVVAGTQDQEYRWQSVPSGQMGKIVRATAGDVMRTRSGSLAQVFYHSCSGGMTADAGEIWKSSVSGIIPVKDPHDNVCPDFFWSQTFSPGELGGIFSTHPIVEIEILQRGLSGRATLIRLNDDRSPIEITGMRFRSKAGASRIKSTLFQVGTTELDGEMVWMIQGSGSGHGVGMSQFGAKVLAEEGKSYQEILKFYFPRLVLDD